MVLIFHLGSDVSWLGQPPPGVGRSSQWPWEPGKVDFDHHTGSMPAQPPGQPGEEDTSLSPGASLRHLNCPCTLVPTHPCMTRPSYLGAKPVSTCPHPSAHSSVSVDPLGQSGLFRPAPNREGGGCRQVEGRAGPLVISVFISKVPQNAKASQRQLTLEGSLTRKAVHGEGRPGSQLRVRPGMGSVAQDLRKMLSHIGPQFPHL